MSRIADSPTAGRLILLLGALAAFGPLSIDLYLPALPAIGRSLAAGADAVQRSVTVFLAGFALGMLCYGPLSDRFGRRPVLLGGIALFAAASLACLLAPVVEALIAARFVQALGGGAASVLARAVVRDLFAPTEAIRQLSRMAMVSTLAPLLAPLAGSVLLDWMDWRGAFAALFLWGCLSLGTVWRLLPESLPPEQRGQLTLGRAFAAYGRMVQDPGALGLLLAGGCSFAAMFAYITGGPDLFIAQQGLSPRAYALIFAANAAGILGANYLNSYLVRRVGPAILVTLASGLGWIAALGLVAACRPAVVDLPGVIAALFVVVAVTGLLGANCVGLLMQRFDGNAGAAAALFGAGQFGFGMVTSAAVSFFHDGSARPMAVTIAVASTLSLAGSLLLRRGTASRGGRP